MVRAWSVARGPSVRSSLSGRSSFPPVDRRARSDRLRGEHDVPRVAELPQLLRGPAVLEEDAVRLERIQLAGPETIDALAHSLDQLRQPNLVVRRNCFLRGSPFRTLGHAHEAMPSVSAACAGLSLRTVRITRDGREREVWAFLLLS